MGKEMFNNIPSKVEYMDFLAKRRVLMAYTVKKAYEELCK